VIVDEVAEGFMYLSLGPVQKCLKAAAHQPISCRGTADFLSGSNRVKIYRAISLPQTSRFFVASNRVEAWGRAIQNQDGA